MTDDPRKSGTPSSRPGDDRQLSERLRRLETALSKVRRSDAREAAQKSASPSDTQGFARALRLSSEFVAGIIVGAGIGWLLDRAFGTSPWGFIAFFLLGFVAGVLNVMRAAGLSAGPPPQSGPGEGSS
jgi:ATP synthase protein I